MRVLVVTHGYPPAASGGAEIYARAHARALRAAGDDVVVLSRAQDPTRPEFEVRSTEEDGVRVVWLNNTFSAVRAFADTYQHPTIGALAERIIDEVEPDVAHIHHLTGLSTSIVHALAARRIPRIVTLHDYWLICHRGQLLDVDYRVCDGPEACDPPGCRSCLGTAAGLPAAAFVGAAALRHVDRWVPAGAGRGLRRAASRLASTFGNDWHAQHQAAARLEHMRGVTAAVTRFLAPSRFIRDRFVRFGVAPERITFAPYGFDRTRYAGTARTTSHRLRIGFLGTLMVSKGPHVLLDAFARLRSGAASVDLIGPIAGYHGDDRYRQQLAPLLAREGVTTHGAIAHERVADMLSAIDVLAVPSIWPENSPLVVQEAFLAGVPVVASRTGGIPEIVKDGTNGLLFEPGNPADLARALTRLIDDPTLLQRLRAGLPAVRDIADDVATARRVYRASRARAAATRVAAVVLNYRTPDDTHLAVTSLLASHGRPDEVIVVNNEPADVDRLAANLDRLRAEANNRVARVETRANRGFSGGMNAGIRRALDGGAAFVLLANSDVVVPPDCMTRLVRALDATPAAGIAGPLVLARSSPDRVQSQGLSFGRSSGRLRVRHAGEAAQSRLMGGTEVVDAVAGCFMLVRRDVFDAAGLFDEDYFFGFEDLDFCLRARRAGFATIVAAGAVVYHEGGRSIGANAPLALYFGARNHLLLARRAAPLSGRLPSWLRAGSIVSLNLAHALRAGGGTRLGRVGGVLRGVRDYAIGKFGPGPSGRGPAIGAVGPGDREAPRTGSPSLR